MKKVLYITILACSTLWGSCTEKNKQSARTDSFTLIPQHYYKIFFLST